MMITTLLLFRGKWPTTDWTRDQLKCSVQKEKEPTYSIFPLAYSLAATSYQMVYGSFSECFISIVLWSTPQRILNCSQLTCLILFDSPNAQKYILDTCWEPAHCPHSLITIHSVSGDKCLLLDRIECILYW